ncbi:MAG: hypothetical protein WCD37_17575 [Chloroflexia bacterium]
MLDTRKARGIRPVWLMTALCAFMLGLPLAIAAWSPQSAPASMRAQAEPTATVATGAPATATPAATATSTAPGSPTQVVTGTVTPTETPGTPPPRPTPVGPPPAVPYARLKVFDFGTGGNVVVKRDRMPLDGTGTDNILITISEARLGVGRPVTEEVASGLGVATWDPVYREWNLTWQSTPISGTARLLPAANQPGGWNGRPLLGTADPVFALRTSTLDGAAHLQLFKWNKETRQGEPLRMVPVGNGPEEDAVFDADLDVNVADLNEDGRWEVVADNVAGVQIWSWDGSKYVPAEAP